MRLSFVAAVSENNVIGKKEGLPWHLPNDLKFFKNTTWGMPVIMGRKTFESFRKMLTGRTNIVITRNTDYHPAGVFVVPTMKEAIAKASHADVKEAFIIGGGEIFKEYINIVNRMYLTRVHAEVEGDTFFPDFDKKQWQLTSNQDFSPDEKHQYGYSFQVWDRIAPAS